MRNEKEKLKKVKVAITNLIVAFIFLLIIFFIINRMYGKKISMAITLINNISIKQNEISKINKLKLKENKLEKYPEYGKKYGVLEIQSLNIKLNLYYGDTLSILRNGVGHTAGSYFPGEGGSIICMAHNTEGYLKSLSNIKNESLIVIDTDYGRFTYKLYETRIVNQNDLDSIPLQKEKEILMLYTCYPTNTFGHAKQRFITYSKLVNFET